MTRILFLTALLIAAFTVNVFANEDEAATDVDLTVDAYYTITAADMDSLDFAATDYALVDLDGNFTFASSADVVVVTNQNYEITVDDGADWTTKPAGATATFTTTLDDYDGGPTNNGVHVVTYTLGDVSPATLPAGAYTADVTYTLSLDNV